MNYMLAIKNKSPKTVNEYYYDLRTFFRRMKIDKGLVEPQTDLEEIPIKDVDASFIRDIDLNDLINFMSYTAQDRSNSPTSRTRKTACIRSFYKYLYTIKKYIDNNPAAGLEYPKKTERKPIYLNLEESQGLLGSISGEHQIRDYAIITLFLNCGLRVSELAGISINKIKSNKIKVIGKGNKEREVPLNKACIDAIEDYMKVRPVDGVKDKNALFLSEWKKRISVRSVQMIVKKHLKIAGLDSEKYSAHKLRHTAATLMYKYGKVDIRALQEFLGHDSIQTTTIYTHLDSDQMQEVVDRNPLSGITRNGK
ncbi:MAG: tyrosine recombinase XerC [Clostridia bacterium]|nr:tyrosine recombinase XerC [Clostridia bacterium]